jgi:hypothetical protein
VVREHARKEGIWPPRGEQPGATVKAGEHAGRPGILLAAALAVKPAAGFPKLNGRPAPPG